MMMAVASLALASCNKSTDLYDPSRSKVQDEYNARFIQAFGQPASNHDWGFGTTTRGITRANPGSDVYPATHEYKDADGNVIAGANMNHNEWADPTKEFGGWIVPDTLTEGQKLRVQKYFQANPNLSYDDPHYRHFFVQQVYKGATDPGANSKEIVTAADGSTYTSANMNQLTVGTDNSHINDFNAGTCSSSDVLDNGQSVNGGTSHSDQITLMVNVYDTSCFGYHDTGSSNQSAASPNHNDKMALVSAATIDAWAAANGNPGEAVTDKWNRSFMGFDLAIKEGEQAYERDANGNIVYATYNQAAESPTKAWDGEKIIDIATLDSNRNPVYNDEYKTIMGIGWLTTNKNFYVAADQVTMNQTISMNRAQASTITTIQNAPVLKDVMVGDTYYQSVINLPRIQQLVEQGYLPVNNKNLAEWVKVGKSDGYFSDWIVTLTEAKRIPADADIRIIAEDLTFSDDPSSMTSDFDFNDVVFDVKFTSETTAMVTLKAAGGTLPLKVAGVEVHGRFGVSTNTIVNTGDTRSTSQHADGLTAEPFEVTGINSANKGKDILVEVQKAGTWYEIKANVGEPAAKLGVDPKFQWVKEKHNITDDYPTFEKWVKNPNVKWY